MTLRTVCLHGPESTGKSTTTARLAREFGTPVVAEFGRTYCERYGIDLTMSDLVMIAHTQDLQVRAACDKGRFPVIVDTDALMSAVWADMMFGRRDPWFARWDNPADLYLLFDIDLPWIEDGTRMFGSAADRRRFFDLSKAELDRRGVRWEMISGSGEARYEAVLAAIGMAQAA
ncbi:MULTISPECIES: ATP-binding protein [unclassified Sphingomonas]|uniref:ATP-binding protein n=1 Tax=unclassified Sphingomonas TaxID=196159 RepID=UPI000929E92E|nr:MULTISPECIES: ATP-binding protein [unclassified Sphingomonas]MBN8846720.1 AAA family ATPase [Sphingomonas sp.]OJV32529.1 MAG: N-acetylglucosamine-6-phosphate isomerase [Sphingomonas sp. 67-36]